MSGWSQLDQLQPRTILPWPSWPRLVRSLLATASEVYPSRGLLRIKDKAKYVLRGLATPRLTGAWFELLQEPRLLPLRLANPRILSKLQRPYLNRNLGVRARFVALQQHYRFAVANLPEAALSALSRARGIALAQITLKGISEYSIRLLYCNRFEKEGELTIALFDDGRQQMEFALSFSTVKFASLDSELFVGGLQGIQSANQRERVILITRAMFGMRPKALLFFTLQQLASIWKISKIRAASDFTTVYRDFRLRKKTIHARYDDFWRDCGGCTDVDGNFFLPVEHIERDPLTLKPNKRTTYRRRYEMLIGIREQVRSRASMQQPLS